MNRLSFLRKSSLVYIRQITTLSSASKNRRQVQSLPIREPMAWHGPIVMNTREELIQAVTELRNGTFIKG